MAGVSFWQSTDPERPPPPPPDPNAPDFANVRAAVELVERTPPQLRPDPAALEPDPDPQPPPEVRRRLTTTPTARSRGKAADRYDWPAMKRDYVEGVKDRTTGAREWPSLDTVAERHGASSATIKEHSAAEGWVEQRRRWQAQLEQTRQRARAEAFARESINLEGKALDVAKLGLQLVHARLAEVAGNAQRRRSEGVGSGTTGIEAAEQQKLAAAADLWQRIGLRALGDPEVTRVEVTGAGGAPIEIAQELRRDDPSRLATVVAVLARAGISDVYGDVVDGEVDDDDGGDGPPAS